MGFSMYTHFKLILEQDYMASKSCKKALLLIVMFRLLHFCRENRILFILSVPLWVLYKVYAEIMMHVELSPRTRVGKGLLLPHPFAIVINSNAIIGDHCIIRNCTTIGNKGIADNAGCPIFGNRVEIGSNCVVIGKISIGDNVVIGAGSVVVKSLESNHTYAGNPVRLIR
jgi:putative colanic acid biosynthesis acetyltransferase WcaB